MPSGLTEVYLDTISDNSNHVQKFALAPGFEHLAIATDAPNDKEWCQILDLKNGAQLVCVVKANQLEMRLVHLTEAPLNEYKEMLRGQGIDLAHLLNKPFVSTEQELHAEISKVFKQFEKAQIVFDAPIVPNLCLRPCFVQANNAVINRPGRQSAADMPLALVLATQSNHIFEIKFQPYFLEKGKTIFVEKSDSAILEHLGGQRIRCFERVQDEINNREFFAIGSTVFVKPQSQLAQGQNRQQIVDEAISHNTLTFLDLSDRSVYTLNATRDAPTDVMRATGEVGGTGADGNQRTSWIGRLAENFRGLRFGGQQPQQAVQPANQTNSAAEKFTTLQSEALMAPDSNVKNLEGVVAMKTLTNHLLVAVYTNGLFRVIQIPNLSVLVETNIFNDKGRLGDAAYKAVQAKIAFETNRSVPNAENDSIFKSVSIGIVLTSETQGGSAKANILQTFNLRFNDIQPPKFGDSEDSLLLGTNVELIHTRQQVFASKVAITSISSAGNSAFLYTTLNPSTRETSIFSTSCAQPIWDRGSMELKHQVADFVPIPISLQNSCPQLELALKKHYFERITVPDRFSIETIYTLLLQEGLFDRNRTIKENLQEAIKHANIENIQRFLRNLIIIEEKNSKIMAISEPVNSRPNWRTLVRPLGICVLTEASYISSVEAAINLGSIEKECYWSTDDTRLIVDYLSTLKTSVNGNLHMLNQMIHEQPQQLRQAAMQCLKNRKDQKAVLKLNQMLAERSSEIQTNLNQFQDKILERLVLSHAGKGNQHANQANMEMEEDVAQPEPLNADGLRVMEQSIRHEIDTLSQILLDVYLGQLLFAEKNEDKLVKTEGWICQLFALQKAFNSDFVSNKKGLLKTDRLDNETVLSRLLKAVKEIPENQRGPDFEMTTEASEILTSVVKVFTQSDNLMAKNPTFVPFIARQLIDIGQFATALTYLRTIRTESVGVSFAKFFSMACIGSQLTDKQSLVKSLARFVNQVLALEEKPASRIEISHVFLTAKSLSTAQRSLEQKVNDICRDNKDQRLLYLLLCAGEMASSSAIQQGGGDAERCAALFICRCLQMQSQSVNLDSTTLPYWSADQEDFLFTNLFDSQKSISSTEMLYLAVSNMSDLNTRQTYLLKFFETTRSPQRPEVVRNQAITSCFFSQSDITLLVEALQDKIKKLLDQCNRENASLKWKEQVSTLVQIYHDVAQTYHWLDQFARFAWDSWEQHLQRLISKVSTQARKGELEHVLNLTGLLMTLAFSASKSCGNNFYFHSTVEVKQSQGAQPSRKRTFQEMNQSDSVRSSGVSDKNSQVDTFWKEIDRIKGLPADFSKGQLVKVDSSAILGVILKCRARLICHYEGLASAAFSSDAYHLSKVLAQIGKIDLAVELCLANSVSPAFAIATRLEQIKNLDIRDGEDEEEEKMRQEKINDTVNLYLDRIKAEHVGQLAQFLIQLRISFSAEMRLKLIETKQVSFIVGCYLCPEVQDVVRAVDFLVNSAECNTAIKTLISSDLNQVVNLLQKARLAADVYGKSRTDLDRELQSVQQAIQGANRGPQLRGLFRADSASSVSGLASIQAAIGQNSVIEDILAEQGAQSETQFKATIELKKNIKKCEDSISTLKNGSRKIETELKNIMRSN